MKIAQIRSFFWSAFSFIWTGYRKIRTGKISVFGPFSRSGQKITINLQFKLSLIIVLVRVYTGSSKGINILLKILLEIQHSVLKSLLKWQIVARYLEVIFPRITLRRYSFRNVKKASIEYKHQHPKYQN